MRTTILPPTVLSVLQELQIDIWRTDENGTIVVTCDKDHMKWTVKCQPRVWLPNLFCLTAQLYPHTIKIFFSWWQSSTTP